MRSFDRRLAAKLRERRVMLGLTQQQIAGLLGVTYQQAHKYETGQNRLGTARLMHACKVLDLDVADLLREVAAAEGLAAVQPPVEQRRLLSLAGDFLRLSGRHQLAVGKPVRQLASAEPEPEGSGR